MFGVACRGLAGRSMSCSLPGVTRESLDLCLSQNLSGGRRATPARADPLLGYGASALEPQEPGQRANERSSRSLRPAGTRTAGQRPCLSTMEGAEEVVTVASQKQETEAQRLAPAKSIRHRRGTSRSFGSTVSTRYLDDGHVEPRTP